MREWWRDTASNMPLLCKDILNGSLTLFLNIGQGMEP